MNDEQSNVLTNDEYKILESMIAGSNNVLLFSHIPIRTQKSYKYGKWHNNQNLTIPLNDKLYTILEKYQNKIKAFFSGHIHKSFVDYYKKIPVLSFPFMDNFSYCEILLRENQLIIFPKNSSVDQISIWLNPKLLYYKSGNKL
jgi:hypothetical protein